MALNDRGTRERFERGGVNHLQNIIKCKCNLPKTLRVFSNLTIFSKMLDLLKNAKPYAVFFLEAIP